MKTEILPTLSDALRDEMTDSRSDFTAEDKLAVVMAYLISGGNSVKAAKLSAIHEMKANTIRQWKKRAKWWPNAEAHAKALLQKDLDARYTQMMHRTQEEIMEDAIRDYSTSLKLNPDDAATYNNRGLAYERAGLHKKAIDDFSRAISLAPDLSYAYYNRGLAYEVANERRRAIMDFRKSYSLNPDNSTYQAKMKDIGLLQ